MDFIQSIWDVTILFLEIFFLLTYLIILFNIFGDIFRDHTLSGGAKAVWILVLMFFPILGFIAYLIARGKSMQERTAKQLQKEESAVQDYIRDTAGTSPAQEIAQARTLLDQGVITEAEFNTLKARALS